MTKPQSRRKDDMKGGPCDRDLPKQPLRILFHINEFRNGGTETSLMSWLRTLDRRYFTPCLAVTYPTPELEAWKMLAIPADVPIHVLTAPAWMHTLHQAYRAGALGAGAKLLYKLLTYGLIRPLIARRLRRLAEAHDLACDYDLSLRHLAGNTTVPWFAVSHISLKARHAGKNAAWIARRLRQYRRYAAIATLTPDMLQEAGELIGSEEVKLIELANAIDTHAIRRDADASVELPPIPYIVSVARLDEGQKDHTTLLRAFAQLRKWQRTPLMLVLVGDGRERSMLEAEADALGIAADVRFTGFCANPFPLIRHAQMLVLSSRYEGFGMVLAEAMTLGTPVISTDCPTGPRDLLLHGAAGLLVPIGDVDAMAHAMGNLLTDVNLRGTLTRNGLSRIEAFAPPAANRRMLALARSIRAERMDD